MKKFFSALIIVSMFVVLIGNALADDFSIRNGLLFGMTADEVKKIEKNNGIEKWSGEKETYLSGHASVAGYNNTFILHSFRSDDKGVYRLYEVFYQIGEIGRDVFTSLSQSLIDKYGPPQHSYYTDKYIFPIHSDAMERAILYKSNTTSGPYYEWVLDYNKYHVLIDITLYADSETYGLPMKIAVSYRYITDDDIQAYNDSAQENENRIETERNRDL